MARAVKAGLAAAVAIGLALGGCSTIEDPVVAGACPDVLDYRDFRDQPNRRVDYRRDGATIFAAGHSRDPADEQFPRLAALFAEAKPTLALFEGPDRGIRASAEETIRETGESGYLRFLAKEAGIAVRTLEPSPPEQIKILMGQFPADQVFLFFVLREASRMRDREGRSGAALDEAVTALLGKVRAMAGGAGIETPFTDIAGLQAAFQRYWPGRDWRTADAAWFDPKGDDEVSGGVFNAAINRADSTNRNRRLVRLVVEAVAAGERPFVAIGGSHVPMVRAALDCELARLR